MFDSFLVYLLAASLFAAMAEDEEDPFPLIVNIISALLWPAQAIIVIWLTIFDAPSDPDR